MSNCEFHWALVGSKPMTHSPHKFGHCLEHLACPGLCWVCNNLISNKRTYQHIYQISYDDNFMKLAKFKECSKLLPTSRYECRANVLQLYLSFYVSKMRHRYITLFYYWDVLVCMLHIE